MRKVLALVGLLVGLSLASAAQQTTVEVVNDSDAAFFFLYVSPEDATSWGLDRLGDTALQPGGSILLTLRSASAYDVRAIDENEQEIVLWGWQPNDGQPLRLEATTANRPASDRASMGWIDVFNDTNYEVAELYVIPPGVTPDASENLLRDARLRVSERYRVRLSTEQLPSLLVDVVLVDVDGDRYVRRDVDLETVTELRFTLSDLALE